MTEGNPFQRRNEFAHNAVEAAVRIGVIALLVVLCYEIARPFFVPVVWGVILSIAFYPSFAWLAKLFGGRKSIAALLITLLALVVLIGPIGFLVVLLIENLQLLATEIQGGTLKIPPPPDFLVSLPIVGDNLERIWTLASSNLGDALEGYRPQLKTMANWLLRSLAGVGISFFMFLVAIVISGILLTQAAHARRISISAANRFSGEKGESFVDLSENTVRNVASGVVGVALLQGILAGLGLVIAGVPFAGLIAFSVILLTTLQIGPAVVLIPAMIYAFATFDTLTAVLFIAWTTPVMLLDNILKPILMARGIDVPMSVIFVGVIGGTLAYGLVGLFIGPVILALGYNVFSAWMFGPPSASNKEEQAEDMKTTDDPHRQGDAQLLANAARTEPGLDDDTKRDEEGLRALLARAEINRQKGDFKSADADLGAAFEIAKRRSLHVLSADCYLEYALLVLDAKPEPNLELARNCYQAANKLIQEHGINNRSHKLFQIESRLGAGLNHRN